MKLLLKLLALISVTLWILSCDSNEPPTNSNLSLTLEDVSCTEAWLQLTTNNIQIPNNISLLVNGTVKKTFTLNTQDSLLYIDSLLPNLTYKLQVSSIQNPVSSNEISVATMDTTSHNFSFQSWTFGTIGSSVLYDVAIINENNIWAVGEIMIADTSQNGYTIYNAVHWDGTDWELLRIPNYDYPNTLIYGALQTIFAFDSNDVWFSSYSNLVHYDGNNFYSKAQFMTSINFNGQITKMWGTDKNNIYCVGRNGAIYHYFGTSWQQIESGTTLNINDIWGDFNEKTQEWEILAVAGNKLQGSENKILRILENNTSAQINSSGTAWPLRTLWLKASKKYLVGGSGVFNKNKIGDMNWTECILDISINSTNRIRGLNINEIIAVGGFGEMLHFNGYSWVSFIDQTGLSSGNYLGVDLKGDLCIAVGQNNSNAVITKRKR
jgi:hypothetical protein